MAGLLSVPSIEAFAIPGVSLLIIFLSYSSQFLFNHIEPGPLSRNEAIWFNTFVLGIWWCYYNACAVDPGPKGWVGLANTTGGKNEGESGEAASIEKGLRWCRKCAAVKPPRAHHCKQCRRCIPKMDHHCPWTTNCVSHTNFPHFIRFVFYAVLSMSILAYHLLIRIMLIWESRNLPAYLGPSIWTMAHLLVLVCVNGLTLFALSILLVSSVYSLAINTTMIESWEIERHEALVQRSRNTGGYVYASGGQKMFIERQEFPYDNGIWKNLCQAMGTSNVFAWFLPFGSAPGIQSAVNWEVNGFEDPSKVWPPPDPEKMPRTALIFEDSERKYGTMVEELEAFKMRQQKDYERWVGDDAADDDDGYASEYEEGMDGEEGWTNSDGDRLRDYGVDEEAEILAEDDIPLAELLRKRKAKSKDV